jgi:hypothetical protein
MHGDQIRLWYPGVEFPARLHLVTQFLKHDPLTDMWTTREEWKQPLEDALLEDEMPPFLAWLGNTTEGWQRVITAAWQAMRADKRQRADGNALQK